MNNSNNQSSTKVAKNFFWRLLERCGAQGVTILVSIVLARILDPDVYGIVALVTVFTTIMQVFVDSGLGTALIQKKDADDLDFSTVFYVNIVFCIILYFLMFLAAPTIAGFYTMPNLTSVIRVLSLILIISGVKNVQQAYVSRHMLFKKFFFSTLGGTIGAAVVGIVLAYLGFGVWALVIQMLFNALVDTIVLWITVKWRPKLVFSFERLKSLFSYGWKLLVAKLIDTIYLDLRSLVIGKVYSSEDLAFFNRGKYFPNTIVSNINTSIDSVLLPSMSDVQDDVSRVRAMTRRSIRISSFLMWPLMIGLAVCAEPLVKLLLTDKWLPCVPYLRVFCITYAFHPIHTANLNAIKALGRSDISLIIEIIKKVSGVIILLVTMRMGVLVMAYSLLIENVFCQFINSWPNRTLLSYNLLYQLKDIIGPVIMSVIMGAAVYMISFIHLPVFLLVITQIVSGAVIYLSLAILTKNESFYYIKSVLEKIIKKRS